MDLSALRIFRTVAREGGVTRAAERLHRVQSNITTRVRQLEEELGVPLFIREGRRMHLAPAGQVLLDYADRLLDLAEEARESVRDPRPRGLLRLGAMESTAAVRLPAPLSEYYRRHPGVTLELRTGNPRQLATAVLAGELDAALAMEPIPEGTFEQRVAFEERLVIVSALDHPPIGPGAMPAKVVAFEIGCPHRKRLEDWFEQHGGMAERTIELSSYHALLGCVVIGMGVSLVPQAVLDTFPERGRLKEHPLPPGLDTARTMLFWRR
ncbi:MAG TPA: LysR substrate-binding domain-containing protein, partial [Acetobacteraceae bacterium]|nr:LysR substrate-binding domain-containing protein [Acetobacteraceae bacterium]